MKIKLLSLILFLAAAAPLQAQWSNDTMSDNISANNTVQPSDLPEGTEQYTIGPTKLLVPKSMRILHKGGNLWALEDINLYVARTTSRMEARITALEDAQQDLRARLDALENPPAKNTNDNR